MSVDFFKAECRIITVELLFGLCDKGDTSPAFIDSADQNIWIATVINDLGKTITFTAIDKCIDVFRDNGDMASRCDVMLSTDNCLYLIELKNKVSDWRSDGIEQIESIINTLKDNANDFYISFRKRKAYVANKRHPHFIRSEIEDMERFRDVHKIRLYLEATISIE